jgi:hypothetical protein
MDLMRPISALLISMEPAEGRNPRRRLFMTHPATAAIETPVRITRISVRGCVVADLEALPSPSAQTWLKLPGREPVRILAEPAPGGGLACSFAQMLYPAELEALVAHGTHEFRRCERPRPRCTLL